MTGIELPKQTINALQKGASMFIVPVPSNIIVDEIREDMISYSTYMDGEEESWTNDGVEEFIQEFSKLQIDHEFFNQEEFYYGKGTHSDVITYSPDKYDKQLLRDRVIDASQMSQEQSRYKGIVVDAEVKRVGDMLISDVNKCGLEEEFIFDEFPHKDNQYVFLYKIKEIK